MTDTDKGEAAKVAWLREEHAMLAKRIRHRETIPLGALARQTQETDKARAAVIEAELAQLGAAPQPSE